MTSRLPKLRLVFALGVAAAVSDVSLARNQQFVRVASALAPDVWAFQEMYNHSTAQVKSLLDAAQPLGTPDGWQVYKNGELAIASRYPIPATYRAANNRALVDLPDDAYARDLYLMNAHYKCCGGFDNLRQQSSDQNINWMRDARTPGGAVTLPANTPMIVLGDLNIVEGPQPLTTLFDGDIQNSSVGPDSPQYNPGRLDYIIYTDSAMTLAHSFVLNTIAMSPSDRAAAGLQTYDTAIDSLTYDHLPVVADFLIPPPPIPGDANGDRQVDSNDLAAWQAHFGVSSNATTSQGDTDADGDIDGADFLTWQRHVTAVPLAAASVPEPAAAAMTALSLLAMLMIRKGPR
jgi:hypothetical protein